MFKLKSIEFSWKSKHTVILLLIFFLALFLRFYHLPNNALSFSYDQARDAFVTKALLSGDFKIQGPPASTPGLFHGVLYYYFLAPAFLLSSNPIVAAYWLSLFNALGVFVIYYFAKMLINNRNIALIAAFLYAVSFEATQYATWLSNPTLATITIPLMFLGLWAWLKEKKDWGVVLSAIGLGFSIQAEIFLGYQVALVLFWAIIARKNITIKQIGIFIATLLLSVSTMIVAQVKFGLTAGFGLGSLLERSDPFLQDKGLLNFVDLYLYQIGDVFKHNLYPSIERYGYLLALIFVVWALVDWWNDKNRKLFSWQIFLLTYILSHILIVPFGGQSTPFIAVGIGSGVVLLAGMLIGKLSVTKPLVAGFIIGAIAISNIISVITINQDGQTIFAVQRDLLLRKQLEAIDFTYKESGGEPFSINTVTNPFWINTTWSYLYNWWGQEQYGYLPNWLGRDQVGRLGNNLIRPDDSDTIRFLIIEPPEVFVGETLWLSVQAENATSKMVEEKQVGRIRVQKRIKLTSEKE